MTVGEQLGSGGAHRVLRGDDGKGLGDPVGLSVHSDLAFFHSFQKGRLGPGGGAVQLVGQEQIAQNGAGLIGHGAGLFVVDGVAGDIGGQHIRRKLDPSVLQP